MFFFENTIFSLFSAKRKNSRFSVIPARTGPVVNVGTSPRWLLPANNGQIRLDSRKTAHLATKQLPTGKLEN